MADYIQNNPFGMSNAPGTFRIDTSGHIQGFALPNPAAEEFLEAGQVSSKNKFALYAGLPVVREVNLVGGTLQGASPGRNGQAVRYPATGENISGFTVANKMNASVLAEGSSNVPQNVTGMTQMFYPLGCGIIIPLPASADVAKLASKDISSDAVKVTWDLDKRMLVPATGGGGAGGGGGGGGDNSTVTTNAAVKKNATILATAAASTAADLDVQLQTISVNGLVVTVGDDGAPRYSLVPDNSKGVILALVRI